MPPMQEKDRFVCPRESSGAEVHLDPEACRVCRNFIESFPGTVYMLHADGRFAHWNSCLRDRIVGKSEAEMSSIDARTIVHPDDLALVTRKMKHVLDKDVEASVEIRLLLKGGPEYRWFLITVSKVMNDGMPCLSGIGIDISGRKRAEEALWLSEQRFRSITEQIDAPVFITDINGNVVFMSRAIENLSGHSYGDFPGRPFVRFLDNVESSQVRAMFDEVLADPGTSCSREFTISRKDGEVRHIEIRLHAYRDDRIEGFIGLIYDLTKRKRFETLTTFRLNLLEMSCTASAEELIRSALDEAERATGSTFGFFQVLDPSLHELPTRIWSGRIRRDMADMEQEGVHHPMDVVAFWEEAVLKKTFVIHNSRDTSHPDGLPSGHRPFVQDTLTVPVLNPSGVAAVMVLGNKPGGYDADDAGWVGSLADLVWDIVERQRAEQSESRVQSLMMQIQKMELVGQLAGGIAHEFNNLLEVMLGHAEIALSSDLVDTSVRNSLEEIRTAAERSAELTDQMMAFARRQLALPRELDLNRAVEDSIATLQPHLGNGISISWVPETRECRVSIDPAQIAQVLANLCMNASDAMDGTGTITIATRRLHVDSREEEIFVSSEPGDFVELSVADTGHGISSDDRIHIFEPFFTTRPIGNGRGLGLSSVYGIIRQNRGFIDFASEPGNGSVFRIYLPLLSGEEPDGQPRQPLNDPLLASPTVMVVAEEPETLRLCAMILEQDGYRVLQASTPSDAVHLAVEWRGMIDLVLTDIVMNDMNGQQLAEQLMLISPGFRTLFMSGFSAEVAARQGMIRGGGNFIRKPFTVPALLGKVREGIRRR